jgi:hypothetical protein
MTASHCNLIPPIFNFLTNLVRFSVCLLSPAVSYPPISTVLLHSKPVTLISPSIIILAMDLVTLVWALSAL